MKKSFVLLITLIIGLLVAESAFAQSQRSIKRQRRKSKSMSRRMSNFKGHRAAFGSKKRYWSVGAEFVLNDYFGDIAPRSGLASTDFSKTKPGVGIFAIKRLTQIVSVKGEFLYTRLAGDDAVANVISRDRSSAGRYVRNLSFRNDIYELTATAVFDLIGNAGSYQSRKPIVPYVFIGAGLLIQSPQGLVPNDYTSPITGEVVDVPDESEGEWVYLRKLGTEGQLVGTDKTNAYSSLQFVIPAGVGVRFRISRRLDAAIDFGYRQTFTDYLDDMSGDYVDQGPLSPLARIMSDRSQEPIAVLTGDPRNLDNPFLVPITSNTQTYESNGEVFTVIQGYGMAGKDNKRGGKGFDVYVLTTFKLSYIIGTGFGNPKFR